MHEINQFVFRTDGDSSIGLGHVFRSIALAEMLNSKQFEGVSSQFLVRSTTPTSLLDGYATEVLEPSILHSDEPSYLAKRFDPRRTLVVLDGYQFDSGYQQQLAELGFRLLWIDDKAEFKMVADIVINHAPGVTRTAYQADKNHCKLLLGSKYAILRGEFLDSCAKVDLAKRLQTSNSLSAIVCFGGTDPYGLAEKATMALLNHQSIQQVHLLLAATKELSSTFDSAKGQGRLEIHRQLSARQLADLMTTTSFAIAPSSTICFELCCMKVPVISGFYVDNQERIYDGLNQAKAIYGIGNIAHYSQLDFENQLALFLDSDAMTKTPLAQSKLFDGQSAKRICDEVFKLISSINE